MAFSTRQLIWNGCLKGSKFTACNTVHFPEAGLSLRKRCKTEVVSDSSTAWVFPCDAIWDLLVFLW